MTSLPDKKRSDEELNELRMRNAFAVRPPVQQIKSQALNPVLLVMSYLVCFASVGLGLGKMYIPALVCAGIAILAAIVIFWRKPRSRHHATLIGIISLLVLVFGTVYYLEQLEPADHDAQRPIGY